MDSDDRGFMIGALLTIPTLRLTALVNARLHDRGFHEITDSNSVVMKALSPEGEHITELAAKAGMTKQSIGYLVDQLEAAGCVERVADPRDARAVIIRRTKKGWAYSRAAAEEVARIQDEWGRLLGPAKMKQLKALLAELVDKLGARYEGSAADVASRMPKLRGRS